MFDDCAQSENEDQEISAGPDESVVASDEGSSATSKNKSTASVCSYFDHWDAKESDLNNLTPPLHERAYRSMYDTSEENSAAVTGAAIISGDNQRKPRTNNLEQFPMKLYRMLSVVDDLGLSHVVSWKQHGRSFQVKDVKAFVSSFLPRFFRLHVLGVSGSFCTLNSSDISPDKDLKYS